MGGGWPLELAFPLHFDCGVFIMRVGEGYSLNNITILLISYGNDAHLQKNCNILEEWMDKR